MDKFRYQPLPCSINPEHAVKSVGSMSEVKGHQAEGVRTVIGLVCRECLPLYQRALLIARHDQAREVDYYWANFPYSDDPTQRYGNLRKQIRNALPRCLELKKNGWL